MTETVKDLATEALRRVIDVATQTGEFLEEQAPLVVQELVHWQIASSVAWMVVIAVLMVVWWWGGYRWCKWVDPEFNNEVPVMPWIAIGTVGTVIGAPAFFICAQNALKWIIAPRVALIEYAATLIR